MIMENLENKSLGLSFSNAFFDGLTFGKKREVIWLTHGHEAFLKNMER